MTAAQTMAEASKVTKSKTSQDGLKVVIRRLPPGMTEEEFVTILGDTWKLGNGKVSWFDYKEGKIAREYVAHALGEDEEAQ